MKRSFLGEKKGNMFIPKDLHAWSEIPEGEEIRADIFITSELKGKAKQYNYLNGVLYPWAGAIFRKHGNQVSDVACQAFLEQRFAEEIEHQMTTEPIHFVPSQRHWSKQKLSDVIDSIIVFMAETFSEEAPDALSYISDKEKEKTYKNLSLMIRTKEDFDGH